MKRLVVLGVAGIAAAVLYDVLAQAKHARWNDDDRIRAMKISPWCGKYCANPNYCLN